MKPRPLGYHPATQRTVLILVLDSVDSRFDLKDLSGRPFVAFVGLDSRGLGHDMVKKFCSHLFRAGCAYLCTWGPNCEYVHDTMDEEVIGDIPPHTYAGCLMTTWHANDSLREAIDYFPICTIPDEEYAPNGCVLALAISIGSAERAEQMERMLSAATIPEPK